MLWRPSLLDLAAIMQGLGAKLEEIAGVYVYDHPADNVAVPAAVVGLPEPFDYRGAFTSGETTLTLPVYIVAGRASMRAGVEKLQELVSTGPGSAVAAIETAGVADPWDYAIVKTCTPTALTIADVEYIGAELAVTVTVST